MKKNRCKICKKQFSVKAYRRKEAKFCSSACYGLSRRGKAMSSKKLEKKCLSCNIVFLVYPYRSEIAKYCSRRCTYKEHGAKIAGEKNIRWKGGGTGQSLRMSAEYKRWRLTVFSRDEYTCQMCGSVGKDLQANHIKKFSDHAELRLDPRNGITLCKKCHKSITWKETKWEKFFYSILEFKGVIPW